MCALPVATASADAWSGYIAVESNSQGESITNEGETLSANYQTIWRFDRGQPVEDSGPCPGCDRRWEQQVRWEAEHDLRYSYPCGGGPPIDGGAEQGAGSGSGVIVRIDFLDADQDGVVDDLTISAPAANAPGGSSEYPYSGVISGCNGNPDQPYSGVHQTCTVGIGFHDEPVGLPEGTDTTVLQDHISWTYPEEEPQGLQCGGDPANGSLIYYLTRDPDPPECSDGVDNDGDQLIDYLGGGEFEGLRDPGCQSPADDSEDSPPAKCNDSLDNDGDTTTDWAEDGSGDPGCSNADDDSELGTNACDNGVDDDGDGYADYPDDADCAGPKGETEELNCLTSGQRASAKLHFKAKVAAAGLPDAHLFDFEPFLTYCYGGGAPSEVLRASTFGNIDYGSDTAALELLGFTPEYNSEMATSVGNTATFTGNFDIRFDWLSLVTRFGFVKVVKKVFDKTFQARLEKLLERYNYNEVQSKLLKTFGEVQGKAQAAYWKWSKKVYDKVPGVLQSSVAFLLDNLGRRLAAKLDQYLTDMAAFIGEKHFAKKSAKKMTSALIAKALGAITGGSAFQVWTPVVTVEVLPSGELSVLDAGTQNFLLTVDYSEELTAIP